jgi:hypothetical protein
VGTILLILGVSDAVSDSVSDAVSDAIMGWEPAKSARTRRRYQHLNGADGMAVRADGMASTETSRPPPRSWAGSMRDRAVVR